MARIVSLTISETVSELFIGHLAYSKTTPQSNNILKISTKRGNAPEYGFKNADFLSLILLSRRSLLWLLSPPCSFLSPSYFAACLACGKPVTTSGWAGSLACKPSCLGGKPWRLWPDGRRPRSWPDISVAFSRLPTGISICSWHGGCRKP